VPLHEIVNAIPYKLKTGGQIAAATALTEKYNEEGDNPHVSCKPNDLVFFNPVIHNGPGDILKGRKGIQRFFPSSQYQCRRIAHHYFAWDQGYFNSGGNCGLLQSGNGKSGK